MIKIRNKNYSADDKINIVIMIAKLELIKITIKDNEEPPPFQKSWNQRNSNNNKRSK